MFNFNTSKEYWNERSELFANYYISPSIIDKTFRKAIFRRAEVAASVIEKVDKPKLLDVGCGPAINIVNWGNRYPELVVTGIDFAPEMVKYAKKIIDQHSLNSRVEIILGDFCTHNFEQEKFDIAVALGVFDYTKNSIEILKKMCDLTKSYVVGSWPSNGFRMSLRRLRYTCPLYGYTIDQVVKMHHTIGIKDVIISSKSSLGFTTITNVGG